MDDYMPVLNTQQVDLLEALEKSGEPVHCLRFYQYLARKYPHLSSDQKYADVEMLIQKDLIIQQQNYFEITKMGKNLTAKIANELEE
jgi:hypothetical protein